jgi:hypothetical protein
MKLFAIAFGIACGVGVTLFAGTFAILTLVGIGEPVAAAAALGALPITTFPKIGEFLERQEGKKNLASQRRIPVYDFRGFQIAWPLMVVIGTVAMWGALAAVAALQALTSGAELEDVYQVLFAPFMIIQVLAAYFIGRWIGTRCSRHGVMTMLLVAFFSAAGLLAVDVTVIPHDLYVKMFEGEPLAPSVLLQRIALMTSSLLAGGLLGYWRGRKYRLSTYLHYLLGVLPAETRDAVVELAFDEAQKAASPAGRARISATR